MVGQGLRTRAAQKRQDAQTPLNGRCRGRRSSGGRVPCTLSTKNATKKLGNVKKLECPTCREVTEVKRGKAANLLKNFSLLC